jgi:hypothetical protein
VELRCSARGDGYRVRTAVLQSRPWFAFGAASLGKRRMSLDGLCGAAACDLPVNGDGGVELTIFFIESLHLSGHRTNYPDQFPIGMQRLQDVVNVGKSRMSVSHVFSL